MSPLVVNPALPVREKMLRRVVPAIATLLAIALFVTAGNWQRGRMHEKERLRDQIQGAAAMAPVPLPLHVADWQAWQFRQVEVEGRYDAARQILLDNRVQDGRVGYHVVTPLRMADGRTILVNRGFAGAGPTRGDLPDVPPPAGDVRVRGALRLPAANYLELTEAVRDGNVWQNLDPGRFSAATGLSVLPVVIEQGDAPDDGLVRKWRRPDTGIHSHRVYMMQWYAFAALAAGLWGWFALRRRGP